MEKSGAAALDAKHPADTSPGGNVLTVSGTSTINGDDGNGSWGAIVEANVSPAPSSQPQVIFSTDSSAVTVVPTPTPNPSASPGPPAVYLMPAVDASESGKSVSATIGDPVDATVTIPLITYKSLVMSCIVQYNADEHISGVKWTGSDWADEPDPTQADFYITYNDSRCGIGYYTPGQNVTFNFPGGGKTFSDSSTLDVLSASDWVNSETSIGSTLGIINPDGSMPNKSILFKTRDGAHYVKVWWLTIAGGTWAFAYQVF